MNETTKLGITLGAVALAVLGGGLIGHSLGTYEERNADITVMPCSAWADTQDPVIPPHTFAGACSTEDGTLSIPVNGEGPIERCKSDDFNDGTQDYCYTVTVKGQFMVISKDDKVVS